MIMMAGSNSKISVDGIENVVKSGIRDIKINLVNGKSIKPVNEIDELDFIYSNFKDDVITGSAALKIFGLLDRNISDIDIILSDPNRFSGYDKSGYNEEEIESRLGYIDFKYKKWIFSISKNYEVDFFRNPNLEKEVKYFEFINKGRVFKVHDPIEIISFKFDLYNKSKSRKHLYDLLNIIKSYNKI